MAELIAILTLLTLAFVRVHKRQFSYLDHAGVSRTVEVYTLRMAWIKKALYRCLPVKPKQRRGAV